MQGMQGWKRNLTIVALGLALATPSALHAQQGDPPDEPAEPAEPMEGFEPEMPERTPRRLALYLAAGFGMGSADEIDLSNETFITAQAENFLDVDELVNGRAAIGWKFPAGKGDIRLVFNGFEDESFVFRSRGLQEFVNIDNPQTCLEPSGNTCLLTWWRLTATDGLLVAQRFPPTWNDLNDPDDPNDDDIDNDDIVDRNEVNFPDMPDLSFTSRFPETFQHQLQSWDVLYGREFGTRRLSSHWWAGVRWFKFEGNMPSTAWTNVDFAGAGFQDGTFLRPLIYRVGSEGGGPSAAWEIDWNFFDKGLQLFAKGGAAFTFNDVDSDSGLFFTLVRVSGNDPSLFVPAPARVTSQRNKSTWQTQGTAGLRLNLRNGLEFEAGYQINGFLDTILMPVTYNIPQNPLQVELDDPSANVSAIFSTRDYIIEGFYGQVGFQF